MGCVLDSLKTPFSLSVHIDLERILTEKRKHLESSQLGEAGKKAEAMQAWVDGRGNEIGKRRGISLMPEIKCCYLTGFDPIC